MFKNIVLLILFLSPVLTAQDDFNNRFMLASRFEQAGEYVKAKEILEDLYLKQPASYQVFEVLNRVYIQLKEYEKSEKIINARLAANPLDVNMYGLLGKTYHIKGEEQKAFETWNKALELSGGNLSFYRVIANYAVERRSFGKAIEILNKGKEKAPDPHVFSYDIANLYSMTMNYIKAAEEYVFILEKLPQEVHNVRSRINGYINKPEAVKPTLEVFSKAKNKNSEIKSVLAWLYVEDKNFDEAYKLYKDLDKERGAGGGDIYNYAQMLFSIKEYQKAAEIFSDIVNNSSSQLVSAAKMGYAKSMEEILNLQKKEMRNVRSTSLQTLPAETDKLIETYLSLSRTKVQGNPDFNNEALFRAARLYLFNKNQPDKAEELYKKVLEYPVSVHAPQSAMDMAVISIKKGELDKAVKHLEEAGKLPRAVDEHKNKAKLMTAEVYFYKKDFENASRYLSEVTANLKDNSANDAIEMSLLLNTKMNDSLSLLIFADGELLFAQDKFKEARDKYSQINDEKGGFMLGGLARLREAEAELVLGNTERSVEILEKISGEESRNIYDDKALYLLGNIYEFALNDPKKAVEIYEKLLARFPSSMYLNEAREQIIRIKNKLS